MLLQDVCGRGGQQLRALGCPECKPVCEDSGGGDFRQVGLLCVLGGGVDATICFGLGFAPMHAVCTRHHCSLIALHAHLHGLLKCAQAAPSTMHRKLCTWVKCW